MGRLQEVKKEIEQIYNDNGLMSVMEAMDIIDKYTGVDAAKLMECSIDSLQADALKLCSFNCYLTTIASDLESNFVKATNNRKFQEANQWMTIKAATPAMKLGEVDKHAESGIALYRQEEASKQKKAMIMRSAVESIQEVVQMLKKVVERLLMQGPMANI